MGGVVAGEADPAGVGLIVSIELPLVFGDRQLAGSRQAVGGCGRDGNRAGLHTGDHARLIHRCNRAVAGSPGETLVHLGDTDRQDRRQQLHRLTHRYGIPLVQLDSGRGQRRGNLRLLSRHSEHRRHHGSDLSHNSQTGGRAGRRVHQTQAAGLILRHLGPVHIAGVVVVVHALNQRRRRYAGLANQGAFAGLLVHLIQTAVFTHCQHPALVVYGHSSQRAAGIGNQRHIAGLGVHLSHRSPLHTAFGNGIQGAGGVVKGHIPQGVIDHLQDLIRVVRRIDLQEVRLIVIGLSALAIGVDGSVVVGSGINGEIADAAGHSLHVAGICILHLKPEIGAVQEIINQEAVQTARAGYHRHLRFQGPVQGFHIYAQGRLTHLQAGDIAVGIHRSNSRILDGIRRLAGGVPRLHRQAHIDGAALQEQIAAGNRHIRGFYLRHLRFRLRHHRQAHIHGVAFRAGNAAQLHYLDVGKIRGIHPQQLSHIVGPEDALVLRRIHHGAKVIGGPCGQRSLLHLGHCVLFHPETNQLIFKGDLVRTHQVEIAVVVDGHTTDGKSEGIAVQLLQPPDLTVGRIDPNQIGVCAPRRGCVLQAIEETILIIERQSNDHGIGASQSGALQRVGIQLIEGSCGVVDVNPAVPVRCGGEAVVGICGVLHDLGIQADPLIAARHIIKIHLAGELADGHRTGNRNLAGSGRDDSRPLRHGNDATAVNRRHIGIAGGPHHFGKLGIVGHRHTQQLGRFSLAQHQRILRQLQTGQRGILGEQTLLRPVRLKQSGHGAVVLHIRQEGQLTCGFIHPIEVAVPGIALVGSPIQLVRLMIHRHGLLVLRRVTGLSHIGGHRRLLVQGVQGACGIVYRIHNALIVAGQRHALGAAAVDPGHHTHVGDLTGHIVHLHQMGACAGSQLVGEHIERLGGIVESHVQRRINRPVQLQGAQRNPVPVARLHGKNGAVGIYAHNVTVQILRCANRGLIVVILGGMLQHGIGRLKGIPAVQRVGGIQIVPIGNRAVLAVTVKRVKIDIVFAGEGDLVVGLIATVVADRQQEAGVIAGYIQRDQNLPTGYVFHGNRVECRAGGSQRNHRRYAVVVGNIELQPPGIGVRIVQVGDLIGIKLRRFVINVHRNAEGFVGNLVAVVQISLYRQPEPGVIGQAFALTVGEIIQRAVIGCHHGDGDAVRTVVIALTNVTGRGGEENLAGGFIGPSEVHVLGIAHHAQIDLRNLIQIPVSIGREHVVRRIIFLQHIGVQAQIVFRRAVIGEEHIGIPVVFNPVSFIPPTGIKDSGIAPVPVETDKGQAQVDGVLALRVAADETVYVNAVFVVLVHVGLVRIGQGNGNVHRSGTAGGHLHQGQLRHTCGDLLIEHLNIRRVQEAVFIQIKVRLHRLSQLYQSVDPVQ